MGQAKVREAPVEKAQKENDGKQVRSLATLTIRINKKKAKRLKKHLEEEHPSLKGKMKLRGKR